jgi:predicted MFS family arabinose efflux permease
LYRSLNHGLGFVGFWFAGRAIDRFKNGFMLLFASAYGLISGGLATLLANRFSPGIFASGSLFFGPYMVARDHLFQQEFTDEQRATMSSISSFAGSIVFAIAALIIGQIADRFGVRNAVAFGILASATALPIYIHLFRRHLNP